MKFDNACLKWLFLLFLIIGDFSVKAQHDYGFQQEMFFMRQPSASVEALGRAYGAKDGTMSAIFYNPAGLATIKAASLFVASSSPYYSLEDARYYFNAAAYHFNRHLTVGLSTNTYKSGLYLQYTDEHGNPIGGGDYGMDEYTLSVASEPLSDLFVGLNTNYYVWNVGGYTAENIYFDLGVIKKYSIGDNPEIEQSASLGIDVTNFTNASLTLTVEPVKATDQPFDVINQLPVINRYGANYQIEWNKGLLFDSLSTFKFMVVFDYNHLLNSEYYSGYRLGGEFTILDLLVFRLGNFEEKHYNFGIADNKTVINEFTYGFGLQLPLYKISRVPVLFNVDYTSQPQVNFRKSASGHENFTSLNFGLSLIPNN